MATLVLQAAGSALGGAVAGPFGAVLGRALGGIGGSVIDQQLFGPGDQTVEGPRLDNVQFLTSREGAPIPRIFGRARVSGEIIWATRLREVQSTETQTQGGKGVSKPTTTVNSYAYFANFAVGLCEGEIAGVRRIWVDGKELLQTDVSIRTYRGTADQQPDGLIEAKQGSGNAPAYRGIAYLVFEDFPLADYGNRIPQVSVEVIRPIGQLEQRVYGVNLIPGATEFGYDTQQVVEQLSAVENRKLNTHQKLAETDFLASLDELTMLCPNLKQVALVVTWFGDDLRAGECTIRPKVEYNQRELRRGEQWRVAGLERADAELVSRENGILFLGGTPSDNTVIRAIAELKSRGLDVCLNPFVMMDIPPSSNLPDPYSGGTQPAFPWRGRITCNPAIGESGTADKTSAAAGQVASFLGDISINDISIAGNSIDHDANGEWSYRRMIFHYAKLAMLAGGVDMFLIGSEMRGLSSVRDQNGAFPFVDGLIDIAKEVAPILGANCTVTYGADWSEYFGYQPQDGSGDVMFHLDPLWALPEIGVVGIDNYMPISDWRDGQSDFAEGRSGADREMLARQVAGGEGFDWYYLSNSNRRDMVRTPITDGLGKPWVFRYKDLVSWWSNEHFDRLGGIERTNPTGWVPKDKPIVFTEFGCPAIHNGPVQPNVFFDPKSSENASPYFSNSGRDDDSQRVYIEAQQRHWDKDHAKFLSQNNPTSDRYSGRMVDFKRSQLWAWDARPYPAFPTLDDVWSDGDNWHRGHWLTGRLGSIRIADLLAHLLSSASIAEYDTSQVDGTVAGYVVGGSSTIRGTVEALLDLYGISVTEEAGVLIFRSPGQATAAQLQEGNFVQAPRRALVSKDRGQVEDLPEQARLSHLDPNISFQSSETLVRRISSRTKRQVRLSIPLVIETALLKPVLESWMEEKWASRETITFGLPMENRALQVGDEVEIAEGESSQRWKITHLEESDHLVITAKVFEHARHAPAALVPQEGQGLPTIYESAPLVHFLNLPYIGDNADIDSNRVAISAKPWLGPVAIYSSPSSDGFLYRQSATSPAFVGELVTPLDATLATSRWNWASSIELKLLTGAISSENALQVLNGANAIAVRVESDAWEIIQFQNAALVDADCYRLTGLLRGQSGTELEAAQGASQSADVVVLNQAVAPLRESQKDRGLALNWLAGPAGKILGDPEFVQVAFSPGYRGDQPYRPAHLKIVRTPFNDLSMMWVRRDRLNSDDWEVVEVPLSEAAERYEVRLTNAAGSLFEVETEHPVAQVASSDLISTFGAAPQEIEVEVRQLSTTFGAGPAAVASAFIN